MGKKFENELNALEIIYNAADKAECNIIVEFLKKYRKDFLLLVGSGGSYSMAAVFELMCTKSGIASKRITPIELYTYKRLIPTCAVIIFTAGGKNKDTINAYKFVNTLEARGLLTICMSIDAPIKKIQSYNLHNYFFEYQMPVKKDGYLAVESLIASIVISMKAFYLCTRDSFFNFTEKKLERKTINNQIDEVISKESIIVLFGGLTIPAAIDLESKFGEASLGNIQLVDFRNFAHGRHFWISNRMCSTGLIALVGKDERVIADKTFELIPKDLPVCRIDINFNGGDGVIDSLLYVFEVVNRAGKYRNIDPGMPKVEEFGRKLYHINYNESIKDELIKNFTHDPIARGVYRKIGLSTDFESEYYNGGKTQYNRVCSHKYKGIIFDYDGTLHIKAARDEEIEKKIFTLINVLLKRGIKIGVATGRGKSVRLELQKYINKSYWDDIIIAYYNGGCIGKLSDDNVPNKKITMEPEGFFVIKDLLKKNNIVMDGVSDNNPYQLSYIEKDLDNNILFIENLLKGIDKIKIVKSSHSVDVIPTTTSKNNIIEYFMKNGYTSDDFLRVGDSGDTNGNDFELLNNNNGISVDQASLSKDYCWNFSRLGLRNTEATLNLLENIISNENTEEFLIGGF